MSWNQWGIPPVPPTNITPQQTQIQPSNAISSVNTYATITAPPSVPAPPPANTAFNYGAMTAEQQFAIQQNWQQWQAYQQQYAQWHAQYGEQYQREMQAKLGSAAPQLPYTASGTSVQTPTVFPQPVANTTIPPYNHTLPPPITTPISFYNKPPPPPENDSLKFVQSITNRPPPPPQDIESLANKFQQPTNASNINIPKQGGQEINDQRNISENFNKNNKNFDVFNSRNQSGNKQNNNQSYDRSNSTYDRRPMNQEKIYESFDFKQQSSLNKNSDTHQTQNRSYDRMQIDDIQKNNTNSQDKSREELLFDEQFRKWEEEFENWKRANVNHPDRKAYREYEMKFEECRRKLVERREQMRKRKLEQTTRTTLPQPINENQKNNEENITTFQQNEPKEVIQQDKEKILIESKKDDVICIEEDEKKDKDERDTTNGNVESNIISDEEKNKQEFIMSSNSSGGIPGLDLVDEGESKTLDKKENQKEDTDIIDLEKPSEEQPVVEKCPEDKLFNKDSLDNLSKWLSQNNNTSQQKKIPSLFDQKIEKPEFSPPRNLFDDKKETNESQINAPHNQSVANKDLLNVSGGLLPDNITKALQDPNVLALLSSALKVNTLQQNDQVTTGFQGNRNNMQDDVFKNQTNDFGNDRNFQSSVWQNQDNRNDWMNDINANNSRFGNNFPNNNNQRNRYDDPPKPWQNYDRNDNRGPNYVNNERNRGGGFSGRRNDNIMNENNENSSLNPFKNDFEQNRENQEDRKRLDIEDMNPQHNNSNRGKMENRERNRNRDRDRNRDNRSNSSRSNNRSRSRSGSRNRNNYQRTPNKKHNDDQNQSDINRSNEKPTMTSQFNPFRRGENLNKKQSGSDEYFKPAQIIDYQNKSLNTNLNSNEIFPLAKVVDYGHKPNRSKEFSTTNDNYFPMKTIDYGHSSSKKDNKEEQKVEKTSSFSGGFGDFLASKAKCGGTGNDTNNKVEDFKSTMYNNSRIVNNYSQSDRRPSIVESTTNQGISNTKETKNNHPQFKYNIFDKIEYNKFDKKEIIDNNCINNVDESKTLDQISDGDDDECFNEVKVSNSRTIASETSNISSSFSLTNTMSTTMESNKEILIAPPPPPMIIQRNMFTMSTSTNKPTYSYNHTNKEEFENLLNNYSNSSFPNSSITSNINDKQLIFPSLENHNTITIDEILFKPGRDSRPKKIVIILRGPPGSGKSYLAKLIKDKEFEMKGSQPRILSIDDYFMNEIEKEERCPKTSRKIITQDLVYEFDKEMEQKYIQCLLKSYKKTLTEGLFNFIIVDCHNQSLGTFNEFYNLAKTEGFTPYTIDLICDIEKCLENNIHNRKRDEIETIIKTWNQIPEHYIKLDVSCLLEKNNEIEEVEMEDAFGTADPISEENSQQSSLNKDEVDNEDENSNNENMDFIRSKWDVDNTEERLARLDGISKKLHKHDTIEDFLQMEGWEPPTSSSKNKKRVRWADIEEKRAQDKMRAIGFVVGQTDWNRMMDPTQGSSALTKTKYIERANKSALKK